MLPVTAIVPIYKPNGLRLRNLHFTLERMKRCGFKDIIVAAQTDRHDESSKMSIDGVRTLYISSPYDVIHKSFLVNIAVKECNTPYVWVNDADIVLPFQETLGQLTSRSPFFKPFKFFVYTDEEEAREFIEKGSVRTKQTEVNFQFCAGSFIANKEEFMRIGGMDEKYVGWGYEDTELADRIKILSSYEILTDFIGVHLYHETDDKAKKVRGDTNRYTYSRYRSLLKTDLETYIFKIKSPYIDRKCINSKNL